VTRVVEIERVAVLDAALIDGLGALLIDAVDGGASVGFHAPLQQTAALAYWRGVAASLEADNTLWIARDAQAPKRILGSVQLQRGERENSRHRAEVCKLMVLRDARRTGLAARLMAALEAHALAGGLRLLMLDTEAQSPAEAFYQRQGWRRAGEIPEYASRRDGTLIGTALYFKPLRGSVA